MQKVYINLYINQGIYIELYNICIYVYVYVHMCIYMHTYTYVCIYDIESTVLLCVDLCLELRWSTTGCHLLTLFFLSCNTFGERPKLRPGPHSVHLCACLRCLGLSERCLCACTGLAFNARWCTGFSLWLISPFWEGNALPAIYLHPVWICPTISNSRTTYICTGLHMFFPHKPCFHLPA